MRVPRVTVLGQVTSPISWRRQAKQIGRTCALLPVAAQHSNLFFVERLQICLRSTGCTPPQVAVASVVGPGGRSPPSPGRARCLACAVPGPATVADGYQWTVWGSLELPPPSPGRRYSSFALMPVRARPEVGAEWCLCAGCQGPGTLSKSS